MNALCFVVFSHGMTHTLRSMLDATRAGARQVMDVYAGAIDVDMKADNSPLTEADRRSHEAIVSALEASVPTVPILSEEGAHEDHGVRTAWERYFLIDPLDGTKEFIKRNGEFTVNVALVERNQGSGVWEPTAGVVYAPELGELFVGSPDGAYLWTDVFVNESEPVVAAIETALPLPRPDRRTGRPYTVVASRSHMSPETEQFIDNRRRVHPDLTLISAGSSLKLCRVADGSADVYPRFAPTMEWDTGAGDAVARAAGCTVQAWDANTGRAGSALEYNKQDLHNPWFLVTTQEGLHQ
mgnify:FL=1